MDAVPVRTCAGCRAKRAQSDLIRVVAGPGGAVVVDSQGRRPPGRGAYVCDRRACVERALDAGGLRRTLRYEGSWPEGFREELLREIEGQRGNDG